MQAQARDPPDDSESSIRNTTQLQSGRGLPKVSLGPPILGARKDEAPSGETLEASEATAHGLSFPADP